MKYIKNGEIYSQVNTIELDGQVIFNPSHENILKAGYEVYVAPEPTEEELLQLQNAEKIAELEGNIADKETDFMKALETWLSANATGEVKEIADERLAIRNEIDAVGKVIQTAQGNGTMEDPYKVWKVGMSVVAGDLWMTQDGYLWQAKKSGVPSSSTDAEYWDIPE